MPTYSFFQTDAGRSDSRPGQANDCSVRALALARGLTYREAYALLRDAGRQSGRRFRMSEWLDRQPWAEGRTFPAIRGQRRMTPVQFCAEHPEGIHICKTAKHVFAVIEGVVHDDAPVRDDRCVYRSWRVTPDGPIATGVCPDLGAIDWDAYCRL